MRRVLALAALVTLCAAPLVGAGAAQAAVAVPVAGPATAEIQGSGSSWAFYAIQQWIYEVEGSEGLQVNFTDNGSAEGRSDFRNYQNDFAVSDIGFQGADPLTGSNDSNCQQIDPDRDCRAYVYLPIVAGGTAFPYHIVVGGRLVDSLRLSGTTLAKIFTNRITNWDNSEIANDNNHHFYLAGGGEVASLPDLPIIPVVHSEGSGTTAQFTLYLDTLFPGLWRPFAGFHGPALSAPPGTDFSEYWPRQGNQEAANGSDGVMDTLTSAADNGAIGFNQYSYSLGQSCSGCGSYGWPTALLENKAGYFTAPTQYNVAVALTQAQINMDPSSPDYLLQKLNNVYTDLDKRTYAMSSYSYMIIPTSPTDQRMSTPKRQALAWFIDWDICGGQANIGKIGYSPLPVNLAQASFAQMYKLHTADPAVQISNLNIATQCDNPTFWAGHSEDINYLAQVAPEPAACDQANQGPCSTPAEAIGSTGNPVHGKAPAPANSGSPTSSSSTSTSSSSTGTSSGTGTNSSSSGGTSGNSDNGASSGNGEPLVGTPTSLAAAEGSGDGGLLAGLAAVEVLLLLAIPPIIVRRRNGRGFGRGSGR